MSSPVWNLRAVIWFHFTCSSAYSHCSFCLVSFFFSFFFFCLLARAHDFFFFRKSFNIVLLRDYCSRVESRNDGLSRVRTYHIELMRCLTLRLLTGLRSTVTTHSVLVIVYETRCWQVSLHGTTSSVETDTGVADSWHKDCTLRRAADGQFCFVYWVEHFSSLGKKILVEYFTEKDTENWRFLSHYHETTCHSVRSSTPSV